MLRSPSHDKNKTTDKECKDHLHPGKSPGSKNIEMKSSPGFYSPLQKQRKQPHHNHNETTQIEQHNALMVKINDLQCKLLFEKERNHILQQKIIQEVGNDTTIDKVGLMI